MCTMMWYARPLVVCWFLSLAVQWTTAQSDHYDEVRLLNLVQNCPGDPLGRQQSNFVDPEYLTAMGFTGDVATGEYSPALIVPFTNTSRPEEAWRLAQLDHILKWARERKRSNLAVFYWIDLMVFPISLLDKLGSRVSTTIFHNNTGMTTTFVDFRKRLTRQLLKYQLEKMFQLVPDMDGIVIRTGETYVYDNPFHTGNSPVFKEMDLSIYEQNFLWASFISFVRASVPDDKYVVFRSWRNWATTADTYQNITNAVEPHPKLIFSIKQQAGDYFRYALWNPQIGIGIHPQVIEISAQRAWEGKGAYPNYMSDQVIHGYQELPPNDRIGLERYVADHSVLKGIWIWSRGDGWWGPYLKGNEVWPTLMSQTLARYWLSNGTVSEAQAFVGSCQDSLQLDASACRALRMVGQIGAEATLYMRYCPEVASVGWACWLWYRDDRIGGMNLLHGELNSIRHGNLTNTAISNRQLAVQLMRQAKELLERRVVKTAHGKLRRFLRAHVEYGIRHFSVMEAAWRVMLYGLEFQDSLEWEVGKQLDKAIADYDIEWAGYRSLVLLPECPSLFFDYFFNLPGDAPDPGIGATVDYFRGLLVSTQSTKVSLQ